MSISDIRATFFQECDELLEALGDGLAEIDSGTPEDPIETVNAVFRAVHSIKGGAAAFNLDPLVRFAHQFETVLDEMRAGRLAADSAVLRVCFRASDHLSDLVSAARDDAPAPPAHPDLATQLAAFAAPGAPTEASTPNTPAQPGPEAFGFVPLAIPLNLGTAPGATRRWSIRFVPTAELFAHGHEPAHLFRALAELGTIEAIETSDELPEIETLAWSEPHLSWRLTLATDATEAGIAEVFEFAEGLCELDIAPEAEEAAPEPPAPAPDTAPAAEPSPPAPASAAGQPAQQAPARNAAKPAGGATVRVDLDLVDRLINIVGELVINQSMLAQCVEDSGLAGRTDVASGLDEFKSLSREIQEYVMAIRAQSVKPLFQRMGRIVREASDLSGKSVRLETVGDATEVDKTVIERLVDPLTHILRNAVDHGLESPEARRAAGKPETGCITLSAAHRSGRVLIDVSDDGAGINRPKVRQIAVDKGLIAADAVLSDPEIDKLLFLPGFSTNDVVTDLSGRGVGMDVVKSAIQGLGGRVGIQSTPGKGTTFSISLPLTLAVLDGMVVDIAGETMVVPITAIVETMRPAPEHIHRLSGDGTVVAVRDSFLPVVDLGAVFGHRAPSEDYSDKVLLLIESDQDARWALAVDRIHDQRQVVIKGLEENYGHVPGVAAATILGDGKIALIIDPEETATRARPSAALGALPAFEEF